MQIVRIEFGNNNTAERHPGRSLLSGKLSWRPSTVFACEKNPEALKNASGLVA